MNIEFKTATPMPTPQTKESIIVSGRVVGGIEQYVEFFHVAINVPVRSASNAGPLAQGHGKTKEEAIKNAFAVALEDADTYIAELKKLQAEMEVAL